MVVSLHFPTARFGSRFFPNLRMINEGVATEKLKLDIY